MSKINDDITVVDTPSPLSNDVLLKMLVDSQKEQAIANTKLAEALLESRKPYIDPRIVQAMEQNRKDREGLVKIEIRRRAIAKKVCPHLNEGGKSNIKWMQHSNGIIMGVCGTCQSQFDATHSAEDAKWLRQDLRSQRNMGRAGEHARKGTDIADF